jgi:hypothetical protein
LGGSAPGAGLPSPSDAAAVLLMAVLRREPMVVVLVVIPLHPLQGMMCRKPPVTNWSCRQRQEGSGLVSTGACCCKLRASLPYRPAAAKTFLLIHHVHRCLLPCLLSAMRGGTDKLRQLPSVWGSG